MESQSNLDNQYLVRPQHKVGGLIYVLVKFILPVVTHGILLVYLYLYLYLHLFLKHGSNPSYLLPLVRPSRGSAFSSSVPPVGTDRIPHAIRQIEPDSNTAHMDIKQVHASLPSLNESPSLPIVIAAIINRCPLL